MAQAFPRSTSSRMRAESTPGQGPMYGQGRIARPAPVDKRESALRASILDTALELGVGTSSTVANWIFNPVMEGDEDTESTLSPSLTYASTATSEDSLSPARLAAAGMAKSSTGDFDASLLAYSSMRRAVQFDLSPSPVSISVQEQAPKQDMKQWHRKLRKAKPKVEGNANGYESDGGYMSEGVKSEKEGKKKSKAKEKEDKKNKKNSSKDATDRDDDSDGGYLSDILYKRRNKKAKAARAAKLADANAVSLLTDYDTDGHASVPIARSKKDKKSKFPGISPATGDESDGGNLSESSTKKKRFFRLRRRAESDAAAGERDVIPPVPPMPILPTIPTMPALPLPIAERFARSDTPLGSVFTVESATSFSASASASASMMTLRTETPGGDADDDASFLDTNTISSGNSSADLPLESPRGLTRAFRDAESVRTPSTDVLRAFGRQGGLSTLTSPTTNKPFQARTQAQVKFPNGYAGDLSASTHGRGDSGATEHTSSSGSVSSASVALHTLHGVSTLDVPLPRPKRNPSQKRTPAPTPMQISQPNTRALFTRPHPPPMTFTPPSPNDGSGSEDKLQMNLTPRSPNPETGSVSFSVVVRPTTPTGSVYESLPQSPAGTFTSEFTATSPLPSPKTANFSHASNEANSQTGSMSRTHQHFAKYDLPPPSPPPMRPLPMVPPTLNKSPTQTQPQLLANKGSSRSLKLTKTSNVSRPGTGDSATRSLPPPSPLAKSRSESAVARPDTAPVSTQSFRPPALRLATTPPSSAPAMIRSGSGHASGNSSGSTTPLFLQRIPSIQRGKESPFPAKPVLFRADSAIFGNGRLAGASSSSVALHNQSETNRPPLSADAIRRREKDVNGAEKQKLAVHWSADAASRSTSDLDQGDSEVDDGYQGSFVDFGSSHGHEIESDRISRRSSTESHPDIESVLSALQDADEVGMYADHSGLDSGDDDDDGSHYPDEEAGRMTQYFDADGDSDTEARERYSVWSEAEGSRTSILDAQRSGSAREKLARRVGELYSREGIAQGLVPPVPTSPSVSWRGVQR